MNSKAIVEMEILQDKLRRVNKRINYYTTQYMLVKLSDKPRGRIGCLEKLQKNEEERLKILEDMHYWMDKDK